MRLLISFCAALLLIAAAGLAVYFIYSVSQTADGFHPTLKPAHAFLASDADGFVATFSAADFLARGLARGLTAPDAHAHYNALAAAGVRAPTPAERARLPAEARDRAVVVEDPRYEGGLPHTRGEFMFLPAGLFSQGRADLDTVVAHELVHLRQRARPAEARAWAEAHGYRLAGDGTQQRLPLQRANPDLDGLAWEGPDGRRVAFVYTSESPRGLQDGHVVGGTEYEHPYEAQAYSA